MSDLRQKLLMELFREYRDWNFLKGTGSYKPGRRLSRHARPIDRVYQTVDRYIELDYTENIVDYYKKLHLAPLEERQTQRVKDKKNQKIKEQKQKNLKFIEENKLREHPTLKGFYGTKDARVFSSKGVNGSIREIKPSRLNTGYYLVNCGLDENGKKTQISLHRFIAQIFLPNPSDLPEVNHLDENKGNCRVSNLEWSTHVDNVNHSIPSIQARRGKEYIVENFNTGEKYKINNISKWCRDNKVRRRSFYDCILGKQSTVKNTYKITLLRK